MRRVLTSAARLRWFVAVAAISMVTVAGALAASDDLARAAAARDRTVTDMPDDISGPQVHFLYVVPSDGADGQLDTNGTMEQSIARIERWFVKQAVNQGLRVDTYNGVPDITFVRLRHIRCAGDGRVPWPLVVMGEDLVAAGFNNQARSTRPSTTATARGRVEGRRRRRCPSWVPCTSRRAAPFPCRDAPGFGTGTDRPGYFEIGLLHEILHVIGFSPSCAPHASASAFPDHVNDSPTDLMYGPDATHTAGWNWANAVLDFNHDDYYRANIPGCRDLSNTPYLAGLHPSPSRRAGPAPYEQPGGNRPVPPPAQGCSKGLSR